MSRGDQAGRHPRDSRHIAKEVRYIHSTIDILAKHRHPPLRVRGSGTPGENDSMILGTGASYYVDCTKEPYSKHYQMFTYVTEV